MMDYEIPEPSDKCRINAFRRFSYAGRYAEVATALHTEAQGVALFYMSHDVPVDDAVHRAVNDVESRRPYMRFLPLRQAYVLGMLVDDFSPKDIATQMSIPYARVRDLKRRALERIRKTYPPPISGVSDLQNREQRMVA